MKLRILCIVPCKVYCTTFGDFRPVPVILSVDELQEDIVVHGSNLDVFLPFEEGLEHRSSSHV